MRLLATLGAFLFAGTVLATPLHNVVIFGDSLSDNGNLYEFMQHQLPPSPPYFKGRFTNGPVWIEHVIESYFPESPAEHLFDYAFGGAGVSEEEGDDDVLFTLRREVNNYFLTHDKASDDSLFVVWIGANNYLALPEETEKTLQDVNAGIDHTLQRLADKGAKHILVVNIPDLGRTPAALEFDAVDSLTYYTQEHNKLLNNTVTHLKEKYPAVEWLYFDMDEAFGNVLEYPQDYGFTNITGTCANSVVNEITKKSVLKMVAKTTPKSDVCDGYLFFDLVHPTALAHKVLGARARKMLDEEGVVLTD